MVEDSRLSDLIKESKRANKEDRELSELLVVLIASPGWKAYMGLLSRRQQMLADELLQPNTGIDGCIRQEYVKGALSGLIIARDLPSVIIAATKELRQTEEIENAT